MMLRLVLPLLLVLASSACSEPTGSSGRLHGEADGSAVVLTNDTGRTVYHFTADRESLALMLWAPCDDPATCTGIAPGAVERIPYDSIFTSSGEAPEEVVVHAWHLARRPGGVHEVRMLPPIVLRL